jgi:magnesium chelatase subunit D
VGKRDEKVFSRKRGKYSRARLPRDDSFDVALDATLRASAGSARTRKARSLKVEPEDLREKIRRHRSPYAIAFVLDNSASLHAQATVNRTKGVALELLKHAHQKNDKVGLVAFRHHSHGFDAAVLLPLTKSLDLAARRLADISISGVTPLPDAIHKAHKMLQQERLKYRNTLPVMIIITDGLPNIPLHSKGKIAHVGWGRFMKGWNPYKDVVMLCQRLKRDGIATIVVDTEPRGSLAAHNHCKEMASASQGTYLTLSRLTRKTIEKTLAEQAGVVSD